MSDIEMPDESPKAEAWSHSQKLKDEIGKLAQEIKHHEDNLQWLQTQMNNIEETILDLQVRLGKYHVSVAEEHIDNPLAQTEKCIIRQNTSAAGIICRIKKGHAQQASTLLATKDVLGIVATLGKVSDDNLSRLFSEFLGLETMLGLVCKTYRDIEAFEKYDKEGIIDKSFGLHGLGASMGRSLRRFPVYCLEFLRPYVGEFVAEDSQKKLALLKPRLPNGECPPGFLGFAVNMISVDHMYLSCLTAGGHGLRETLFYSLFSRLQVYKTRAQMLHAIPCISDGAVSLDGGMIKSDGLFYLSDRNDVDVRFPVSTGVSTLPAHVVDLEEDLKLMNWKKERLAEDVKREKTVLHHKKDLFRIKSQGCTEYFSQGRPHLSQDTPAEMGQFELRSPSDPSEDDPKVKQY